MKLRELVDQHIGPPVNIEAIIRGLGIELDKKADLDPEISGQLERLGPDEYKISVQKTDSYLRQRFTMAHELGHYLLHAHLIGEGVDDDPAYRSTPDGRFFNQNIGRTEETEANRFAASLLMSKSLLTNMDINHRNVADIARDFQVSSVAMKIRLEGLGMTVRDDIVEASVTP
ncbi:ImmA/IrrE family metallo-endopeptidase [Rhodobacterales bacterium LSUCC1028]|nr:ImmA/IrrE family metallo-endopeptidase [Rhodobacterales bacterium LSUCC1028]